MSFNVIADSSYAAPSGFDCAKNRRATSEKPRNDRNRSIVIITFAEPGKERTT